MCPFEDLEILDTAEGEEDCENAEDEAKITDAIDNKCLLASVTG